MLTVGSGFDIDILRHIRHSFITVSQTLQKQKVPRGYVEPQRETVLDARGNSTGSLERNRAS